MGSEAINGQLETGMGGVNTTQQTNQRRVPLVFILMSRRKTKDYKEFIPVMAWQGNSFEESPDLWNNSVYGAQQSENKVAGRGPYSGGPTRIADLAPGPNTSNIFVVGIVIAKEDARSFFSKKDPASERHLLSFTLRDSPVDFINATCWGNRECIADLTQLFHIGDIVKIMQPGVQSKPLDGSDEKFRPWTPSMYQLNVSETRSTVQLYSGFDLGSYNTLFHIPVKPSNDFYTIADILTNGQVLHGQYISILAAVKQNDVNYSAMRLETLALKWAVTEKFRDYLLGGTCTVYMDNNPLTYLNKKVKLTAVEQRWAVSLAPFNFDIQYRPGRFNANADGLSHLSECNKACINIPTVEASLAMVTQMSHLPVNLRVAVMEESANREIAKCCECKVKTDPTEQATTTLPGLLKEAVGELQAADSTIGRLIYYWKIGRRPTMDEKSSDTANVIQLVRQWDHIVETNGVLYRRVLDSKVGEIGQLLLSRCLQDSVLESLHNKGVERTEKLVRARCYWPTLHKDVQTWINLCERCTLGKFPAKKMRIPLGRLIATRPLEVVAIDYTVLEPSSDGWENVLIITDVFTKFTVAVVTRNQKAETVAKALVTQWFEPYGILQRIHSDNGRNFDSVLISELCKLYGIQHSHTTPYHPAGNGQCQQFNRTLHDLLRTLSEKKKRRWAEHVHEVVNAYNLTPHSSTGYAPFYLMFGRDSRQPIDLLLGTGEQEVEPSDWVSRHQQRLQEAYQLARRQLVHEADSRKKHYDRKARDLPLSFGQRVYRRKRDIRETTTRRKLPCLPDEKTVDPDQHEELSDDERLQWRCIIRSSFPQPLERVSSSDDSSDSPINDGCDVTTDTSEAERSHEDITTVRRSSRTTAGWHSNRFREPRSALNGH
ncbi:hypothetical protein LSAT2_033122 [Lamellibrachia satsuma]|nr:hypothetical protein LSAT2_033122 [Lamellibrachia satsuma]